MAAQDINSVAFNKAELQSERLRIFGVLSFLALLVIVLLVRVFVIRTARADDPHVGEIFLLILTVTIAEYWMLRKVEHSLEVDRKLKSSFWIFSTVLEASVPAWPIALLPNQQIEVIYRPLATSLLLVFAIFIILSILRLGLAACLGVSPRLVTLGLLYIWDGDRPRSAQQPP
jgi:hypothetical protein